MASECKWIHSFTQGREQHMPKVTVHTRSLPGWLRHWPRLSPVLPCPVCADNMVTLCYSCRLEGEWECESEPRLVLHRYFYKASFFNNGLYGAGLAKRLTFNWAGSREVELGRVHAASPPRRTRVEVGLELSHWNAMRIGQDLELTGFSKLTSALSHGAQFDW